jgi:hypothetical protein
MKNIKYIPIIKTGDAEIRGVENLSDNVKDSITPIFELTRSRISKKYPEGDVYHRLNRLKDAFGNRRFILDLTGEPNLSNRQIEDLQDNRNGYKKWIGFLISNKEDFPEMIPTIQISDVGVNSIEDYYERIRKQAKEMDTYFDSVVYRIPLGYEDFGGDLKVVCEAIPGKKIICVIDAGFITQEKAKIYSEKAKSVVNKLNEFNVQKVALSATSFPRNPTEFGEEFNLEEVLFFASVRDKTPLIYGDYATINPLRNLQAGGNGWVPRIDMPTEDIIFYHRSRKVGSYADAYVRVAKLVCNDQRYKEAKKIIGGCWGIEQIELAAEGDPQGLSPSFWISVRMNIHMTLREKLCSI